MIDPLAAALDGAGAHRLAAVPFAALAGLATSVGPCVAPRYLALASLAAHGRGGTTTAAFVGGLLVATLVVGTSAACAGALATNATVVDAALAAGFAAAGIATLWREPYDCAHRDAAKPRVARSGAFVAGAASALVVSPCCTPFLVAFASLAAAERDPVYGAALLGAFAAGHAAPLFAATLLGRPAFARIRAFAAGTALQTVAGSLALALGAYYGLLA